MPIALEAKLEAQSGDKEEKELLTEELPDEVYISIGVDTEKIFSSVPSTVITPNSDRTTLTEAANTSVHVFKIPLDK